MHLDEAKGEQTAGRSPREEGKMAKLKKGAEYLIGATAAADVFTPEDLTEEQQAIADTTVAFVKDEVLPVYERLQEPGGGDAQLLGRVLCQRRPEKSPLRHRA